MILPSHLPTGKIGMGFRPGDGDFRLVGAVFRSSQHPVEASEVVSQAHQRPFAGDFLFSAQTEPAKTHRFLDDTKDEFDSVVRRCA